MWYFLGRATLTTSNGNLTSLAILDNLSDFAAALPRHGSLLAVDASKRRLGLAGTDPTRALVTALRTIERRGAAADLARIEAVMREREAVGLVLGYPLNMDGSIGPMARAARALATALGTQLGVPVFLQDERLTTFAVKEAMTDGRLPRSKKGQAIDHYAAAVILEDCLRQLDAAPERPMSAS